MRADRVSYDFTSWTNSNQVPKTSNNLTPRNKNKQPLVSDNTRRSISPLRYTTNPQNDRVSSSPLRVPLEQAISRCFPRDKSIDKSTSRRTLAKSSRRQDGSFIDVVKKITYEDELNMKNVKAHSQTLKFLKKYFDMHHVIPTQDFISKILHEYGNMWDNQNLQQLLQDFTYKVNQIFGIDGIDPRELIIKTKTDGMLGLIMTIFRQLKEQESTRNSNYTSFSRNPQVMSINKSFQQRLNYNQNVENIKNVVQQFMESMYQCMEAEIYNKFNVEMRRMVLKYREAEKIIKKVNQKITTHADLFDLEEKLRKQKKFYEEKLAESDKLRHKLQLELSKEKEINNQHKNSKFRLEEENRKLKESMEKLQSALINKALQSGVNTPSTSSQINFPTDPTLSRRTTLPFTDRTNQLNNLNTSTIPTSEPFQIKIDTHIVQKDLGPPSTFTTTTFGGANLPGLSPMKENRENNFMDGRYSYSPYGTKFQTSRLY